MRPQSRLHTSKLRPLSFSLARLSSAAAVAAALLAAGQSAQAQSFWYGTDPDASSIIPGDGILWTDPNNWTFDTLPGGIDVVFDAGLAVPGTIQLNGNQAASKITFNDNYALGAYGSTNVLTNTGGNVEVAGTKFATINAVLAGTSGLNLTGGGTLFLTNGYNQFTGNVSVADAGSTLLVSYPGQPTPASRSDALVLGQTTRNVTLSNGGAIKFIGSSYNPDGTTKNFVFGDGGGVLNIAAGFQRMTLDDASQIQSTGANPAFVKDGQGSVQFVTQDFNVAMTGGITVNAGVLQLGRTQGNAGAARFSAFTAGSATTVNSGGHLALSGGTLGIFDQNLTLNAGGILSIQGAEHEFGMRGQLTIGGAAISSNTLTLNGGTILARDSFDPQTARFPRLQGIMAGSGTVTFATLGASGGNSRMVFQRSDLPHTFNGTFVAEGNVALELQPRNNDVNLASAYSGNAIGGGSLGIFPTIELRGFNSSADIRNAGGVATRNGTNFITGWNSNTDLLHDNNIAVTGADAGGIQRLVVTTAAPTSNGATTAATGQAAGLAASTVITGGTGNVLHFKNLAMGNNRLLLTNGNSYGARFDTLTLTGTTPAVALFELNATSGKIEINGDIPEHLAGDGIARWGNTGDLNLSGRVGLATLNIRAGTVNLFGPNGSVLAPNLSAGGAVLINGGGVGGAMPAGFLNLHSDLANTGGSVAAAVNNNRLADNVPVTMLGNSVLRLTSLTANNTTETTGNLSVMGFPEAEVVKQGVAPGQVALTLGSTVPLNLSANSGMSFTAASLGIAGANTSRIYLFGQPNSAFLGANFTAGSTVGAGNANEWAMYDAGGLGVIPFVPGDYNPNPGVGAWANHVKLTAANTLGGPEVAATVNIQVAGALAIGANNLRLNAGGILASTGTNGITGTTGILTTGAGQQQLFVTNNVTTDINAILADNGAAVTLVKNGTGNLRLTNQGQALGGGSAAAAPIAATHANTFTGGIFVNSGQLEVWKPQYIGGNQITLQGGSFAINQGSAPALVNTAIAWGNNVVVNTNSSFVNDDNGESNDASVGQNTTFDFGTLTINGAHVLSTGGFVSDNRFTGATFTGNPTINLGVARSTNSMTIINGVQAGSGFAVEAFGTNSGSYVLGGGPADGAPNTYGGGVFLGRTSGNTDPVLRLDKANGVIALTGDLIINQGTLAFGPGLNLTNNTALNDTNNNLAANRFAGISVAAQYVYASGRNQTAPTATITLLAGNLGENGRVNDTRFGTLIQKNGTLNPGLGTMEVDNWQFSGGAIAFNSGGTFRAGTATLASGAQEINIANNFIGARSRFEIGAGGLTLTGQSVSFGNATYTTPSAGAILLLGGPLTVNADPLNLSATDRQKGFFAGGRDIASGNGRELARNTLDLDGDVRDITIAGDIFYAINTVIQNGGFTKKGPGSLALQNWFDNSTTLAIGVAQGNLIVRGANALGASPVTVSAGGTLKLDGGWTLSNNLILNGPGALIPNGSGVREFGALVAEAGYNRVLGTVTLGGDTTIGANLYQNPSTSATGGNVGTASPLIKATLSLEGAGGVTGTGNLTITGSGDGNIVGGIKTTGGLKKEGGGIWTISGMGTYPGATTVEAGILRIAHNDALGTAAGDTTVFGGNTLVVTGGITSPEPLVLHGTGFGGFLGVVSNAGNNTVNGLVTLGSDSLIRSVGGTLTLGSAVVGTDTTLTVSGAGHTAINGIIATGIGSLVKNDSGNLTLRGGNTFTGATLANGGTVTLDYGASNTSKIASFGSLTLGGGSVSVVGNGAAATVQTVGQLDLIAGGGTVSVSGTGGQTATLDIGPINRFVGASVNFATASNGSILTTEVNVGGILGGLMASSRHGIDTP